MQTEKKTLLYISFAVACTLWSLRLLSVTMFNRRGDASVGTSKVVTCADLIHAQVDDFSASKIDSLVAAATQRILSDESLSKMAESCHEFVGTRGYFDKPVTDEEIDFPLAFSIMIHTSAYQVELLLRAIYRPQNVYCIHVDRKAPPALHFAMHAIANCFSNVFIASRLYTVYWGSISQVYAERQCQRDLLDSNFQWKYFINLAGQEMPLKTNLEMVRILKQLNDQNDIMTSASRDPERTKFRHVIVDGRLERTSEEKTESIPGGIPLRKGGVQSALTRQFVEFLHNSELARELLDWLKDTKSPDETFYQSLASLPAAPGGPGTKGSEHSLSRLVVWTTTELHCRGKFVRNVCVFTWRDLPWLVQQPQLFVNKFHMDYDALAAECILELMHHRTYEPATLNFTYYRKFAETRSWRSFDETEKWTLGRAIN
ncbi:beta-1,3-galactosyl-O-glycosyl-glycoprotein beta-1,6-N-acetylglucosaminyltransferase-like [Ptychodera flava]|uniref:beta-1,3-galactosyl-O-glycosyl-glycoprotein beta-1,6-N-acetylglucosaminyltransferase-like n=1 Tax=Ptychodera flava TaxID=63121 RepID=UPI00396A7162